MEKYIYAKTEAGLGQQEIADAVVSVLDDYKPKRVLILPPDFTRFHSNAGLLTNICWHHLTDAGCHVDILPALGTHAPVSRTQVEKMFGDIPYERFLVHNWRTDVVRLGEVPGDFIAQLTDGLWTEPLSVEVNRRLLDPGYDLIISPGQVVPHEVIGMSNHAKNIFVGVGGSDMINKSHMVGAVYGMERMMGKDHTPVRKLFDYALEKYLSHLSILYMLTVTTAPQGNICTHGPVSYTHLTGPSVGHTLQTLLFMVMDEKIPNTHYALLQVAAQLKKTGF